jgi:hypothetical protein
MTRRKVWRYKCDHCRKSNCSAAAIKKHEASCCKNPNRYCRMCQTQWPRPELLALAQRLRERLSPVGDTTDYALTIETDAQQAVDELRDAAGCCPVCMMAAIIQGGIRYSLPFDLKQECREWWSERDEREALKYAY